jgi:hypothetical protein
VRLFDSIVVFENLPGEDVAACAGAGFDVREAMSTGQSNYPLEVEVRPGRELIFQVRYDPARFDEPEIVRLLERLRSLIVAMSKDLTRPARALELTAGEDVGGFLGSFNEDLELA